MKKGKFPRSVHRDVPSAVSAKEIQRCSAFHHTTGAKIARASAHPAYGSGRLSHRRWAGERRSHSPTETGRATAAYLLWSANPSHPPAASHAPPRVPFAARQVQSRVMTQQKNSGPSGAVSIEPAANTGMIENSTTAHVAA